MNKTKLKILLTNNIQQREDGKYYVSMLRMDKSSGQVREHGLLLTKPSREEAIDEAVDFMISLSEENIKTVDLGSCPLGNYAVIH